MQENIERKQTHWQKNVYSNPEVLWEHDIKYVAHFRAYLKVSQFRKGFVFFSILPKKRQ